MSQKPIPTKEGKTMATSKAKTQEQTPLEVEMENLPEVPEGPGSMMLAEIAKKVVEADQHNKVILDNSVTSDAIAHKVENGEEDEIVTGRKEVQAIRDEIEKLNTELQNARNSLSEKVTTLNETARTILQDNLDGEAKTRAMVGVQQVKSALTPFLGSFKNFVPDWEDREGVKEYILDVNKRVFGGMVNRPATTGVGMSAEKRAWNERVREWAQNNGIAVNPKGRIANQIKAEYSAANPGDPEPEN